VSKTISVAKKESSATVNDLVILREHEGVLLLLVSRPSAMMANGLGVRPREKLLTFFIRKPTLVPKCTDFSIQNA
jgi:hypothetical protein